MTIDSIIANGWSCIQRPCSFLIANREPCFFVFEIIFNVFCFVLGVLCGQAFIAIENKSLGGKPLYCFVT